MTWLEALVLGLIQGLTEFLPVSSSGHLQIFSTLFGIQGEENLTFAVAVHAASGCSTIVVLRNEIWDLLKGLFRFSWNPETIYIAKIALSMIPVAIVGVFFKDYVEALFGSGLLVVGVALLITACLLAFAYYARPRLKTDISFRDAFIIGVAQACAVLPGLSRSGSTIATGILLGNNKENVARFSFLMVLVPILGEAFLDMMKGGFAPAESGISMLALVVGFLDIVVVIEGAAPHAGEADILIELHVEGDTGRVIVENGGAAGDVGQGQGLDAHAEGKGGIGNHPVDVGVLHLDRDAVSAHGAAGALAVRAAAAPGLVTDFKKHGAGEGFGRDSVQLKAYALGSSEAVAAVSLLFSVFSGAGLVNEVALSAGETDQPFALRLEIDGAGRGGCAEDKTGSQEKSQTFFHEKYLMRARTERMPAFFSEDASGTPHSERRLRERKSL